MLEDFLMEELSGAATHIELLLYLTEKKNMRYSTTMCKLQKAYHSAHSKNVDGVGRSLTIIFHENMPWRDRLQAELNYNY